MAGNSDTISTNGIVFNSGDTLSVTITTTKITGGVNGTLYIGETEIPVSSNTLEYTYHYVLTNTGTFNVHFINNMFELDSNNIAITVNAISNVVSAFVNRLKSVFVQKSNTNGLLKNDGTVDTTAYSTFDGNYNNLTNKPSIPSNTSDLTNDSQFITINESDEEYIASFDGNETVINKYFNANEEVKFHYSRTTTTDCDGYVQIGDNDYGIIVGIVETESTNHIYLQDNLSEEMWNYDLSNLDDSNSFDISIRIEPNTQNIESLQLNDTLYYNLILTVNETIEQEYSTNVVITLNDEADIFLNRNYISKVVQDTNSRITDLAFSTSGVYVEKSDLNNNSTSLDPLLADMIDYGMDNDDLPSNPSNVLPTNIVSEWSQSLSDEKAPSEKLTKETIDEYNDLINETIEGYIDSLSWKLVESKNNGQVRVYANDYMVALSTQDRFTFNANGDTTIATISSQYAPTYYLTTNFHPTTYQIKVMIDSNGNINVYNNSTATTGNARIYVTYPLKAKMP